MTSLKHLCFYASRYDDKLNKLPLEIKKEYLEFRNIRIETQYKFFNNITNLIQKLFYMSNNEFFINIYDRINDKIK